MLSDRFYSLRNRYKRDEELERRASLERPLDGLRALIPAMSTTAVPNYIQDPSLSLERASPAKWLTFYDEGIAIMRDFNRKLRDAIKEEGMCTCCQLA